MLLSGLSARYGDDDDASSTDSSVWSRCSSPHISNLESPEACVFSPVQSPEDGTGCCHGSVRSTSAGADDQMLNESIGSEQDRHSLGDVVDWSRGLSKSASDVFTAWSPPPVGHDYASLPKNKHDRSLARIAAMSASSEPRRETDRMSRSLNEPHATHDNVQTVSCSSPDLSTGCSVLRRNSRSFSELSDRHQTKSMTDSTGLRGSPLALVSQVRNSFRQHFAADRKRRQRRIAQHVFTAEASQPQLVSLRRFCDDFRTSCLQQNLSSRRRSLDRMLKDDVDPVEIRAPTAAKHRVVSSPPFESASSLYQLSNVAEESIDSRRSSAGTSSVRTHRVHNPHCHSVTGFQQITNVVEESFESCPPSADISSIVTDDVYVDGCPWSADVPGLAVEDLHVEVLSPVSSAVVDPVIGRSYDSAPTIASVDTPTDDTLQCDNRRPCDEVGDNASDRPKDVLEYSIASTTTDDSAGPIHHCELVNSNLSITTGDQLGGMTEDAVGSCCTVDGVASNFTSHGDKLSEEPVKDLELIDVGSEACGQHHKYDGSLANDLLLLLDTWENITGNSESPAVMSAATNDQLTDTDLPVPLQVHSSASDEVCEECPSTVGQTSANAVIVFASTDDLVNFTEV